jgi:hypothetical protein
MLISWRWRLHSKIGKACKTSGARPSKLTTLPPKPAHGRGSGASVRRRPGVLSFRPGSTRDAGGDGWLPKRCTRTRQIKRPRPERKPGSSFDQKSAGTQHSRTAPCGSWQAKVSDRLARGGVGALTRPHYLLSLAPGPPSSAPMKTTPGVRVRTESLRRCLPLACPHFRTAPPCCPRPQPRSQVFACSIQEPRAPSNIEPGELQP